MDVQDLQLFLIAWNFYFRMTRKQVSEALLCIYTHLQMSAVSSLPRGGASNIMKSCPGVVYPHMTLLHVSTSVLLLWRICTHRMSHCVNVQKYIVTDTVITQYADLTVCIICASAVRMNHTDVSKYQRLLRIQMILWNDFVFFTSITNVVYFELQAHFEFH